MESCSKCGSESFSIVRDMTSRRICKCGNTWPYPVIIKVPDHLFKIEHEFKREEWAPASWAGTEGLKLTVTKVDFENRKVTLEFKKEE